MQGADIASSDAAQQVHRAPRIPLSTSLLQGFADQMGVPYDTAFRAFKGEYKFEQPLRLRASTSAVPKRS